MKSLALVATGVTVVAIAFLFAPMAQPSEWRSLCIQIRPIAPRMNLVMNCDSPGFVTLAGNPSELLRPGSQWQSRPGFVVVGWIAAQPMKLVNRMVGLGSPMYNARVAPFYFGFILVNWLILVASGLLFLRVAGAASPTESWVVLPMAMLLVNIVTKPFFWTPHLQLFNVFVPLLSIYLYPVVTRRWQAAPIWRYAGAGFLLGLASLAYGAFALCVASMTVALVFSVTRKTLARTAMRIVALGAAFVVPPVAWREYVLRTTGSFYMHETDYYNEFVWMGKAIAKGWAVAQTTFSYSLKTFFATLPAVAVLPMVLLVVAALVLARLAHRPPAFLRSDATKGGACFLAVAIPFYALMGFYQERLSWTLTVPLLVLLALILREISERIDGLERRIFNLTLVALAVIHAVYIVATPGPYS